MKHELKLLYKWSCTCYGSIVLQMIVMCADLDASLLCDISCVEGFVIYSNNIYILVVMLQSILQAQHKHHEQIKHINKQKSLVLQWASLVTTNVMLFILYKRRV